MNISNTYKLAKVIWEYHLMKHKLKKADIIFVLGSSDIQVAERGASLFLEGWAPIILISGGLGRNTHNLWGMTEAEKFRDVMVNMGVPIESVFLEKKSTNTGENVLYSKDLLEDIELKPNTVIAVQKPFMERRTFATIKNFWPEIDVIITSPQISFDEYNIIGKTKEDMINAIVGDLQRIMEYPKKGYQIKQEVPKNVLDAYKKLIGLGYNKYLIN